MNESGFKIICNKCGKSVNVNGSETSQLVNLKFDNNDVYIDAYDFNDEGTLYANIGCQECGNDIRGIFVR